MHATIPCTGGAATPFTVPNDAKPCTRWQVTLTGRTSLVVTIKVKAHKSDVLETPSGDSTLDLATKRTLILNGRLDEISIDDTANAAAANFTAEITTLE